MIKEEFKEIKKEANNYYNNVLKIVNRYDKKRKNRNDAIEGIDMYTKEIRDIMIHYLNGEIDNEQLEIHLNYKCDFMKSTVDRCLRLNKELEEKEIERKKYN